MKHWVGRNGGQGFLKRKQKVVLLLLLCVSVLVPLLFLSQKINHLSYAVGRNEFGEEVSSRYTNDLHRLNALRNEAMIVKEPRRVIYKDASSTEGFGDDEDVEGGQILSALEEHKKPSRLERLFSGQAIDGKVRTMKDQLIRARVYLNFAPPGSSSHLVKELKQRMRELERTVGDATKDSDLPRSAMRRTRAMESTLQKAGDIYNNCTSIERMLRAMAYNSEEQVRAHFKEASHLTRIAASSLSRGLHCLGMQLTVEYYALQPEQRQLPNQNKKMQEDLYHYVIFSDNVVGCAVAVNSTVTTSLVPEKVIFHIVTDTLNYPAMRMWFLANPPGAASIDVIGLGSLKWLLDRESSLLFQDMNFGHSSSAVSRNLDSRYGSMLNHLRFFLPDIFPYLDKIVLLDHDVVVQKDLSMLWNLSMNGKVIGVVETCGSKESPLRFDMFLNFLDPLVASTFDANACSWGFGMNVISLREWRNQDLMSVYRKWQDLNKGRRLWKLGSLPIGLMTFYNQTVLLDRRWHILGLGYDTSKPREEIENAAVIHYSGKLKPWLEIAIPKFKGYWTKFLDYDDPYLQLCNIHLHP